MPGKPDPKWQALIDDYLEKLHLWNRVKPKDLFPTGAGGGKRMSKKAAAAYQSMKAAQRTLRDHEKKMDY